MAQRSYVQEKKRRPKNAKAARGSISRQSQNSNGGTWTVQRIKQEDSERQHTNESCKLSGLNTRDLLLLCRGQIRLWDARARRGIGIERSDLQRLSSFLADYLAEESPEAQREAA